MTPNRRTLLQLWACATATLLAPKEAHALRRPRYGGSSGLYLPLNLTRLDPHDPHDLTTTLMGPALFENLYAQTRTGSAYPTLASGPPQLKKGRTVIELRPDLKFSSGRAIDAKVVAASLRRAMSASSVLGGLKTIQTVRGAPLQLSIGQKNPQLVARLLANPRAAIVPNDFTPTSPETCGAFRVSSTGSVMRLERNPLAPRGGAYLDEVTLHSASISDCLRAFEARRSDLGFLGAGLHRDRLGVSRFQTGPVGLALLLPGAKLREKMPVGGLHEALARLPDGPLRAMGAVRTRHAPERWNGGDAILLVSQNEPWLLAVAEEIRSAWSTKGHILTVEQKAPNQMIQLRKNRQFDLMLQFLGSRDISEADTTSHLFQLDGRPPPRGGRTLTPTETGRQLSLGIIGALVPHGAVSSRLTNLVDADRLNLENTETVE